ncbi:MAG: glycosyltransferase family 2 protein [Acidobacteria bacterium]|nr:MAG: glycosyltransferase family 2 protein [Acidobacteriota bacterium]
MGRDGAAHRGGTRRRRSPVSSPHAAAAHRVSAVVVSYNTREDLLRCLDSLRRHAGLPCQVIVVDNASADGSAEAVASAFPEVRLIGNAENAGFSRANNQGLREAKAAYVLFLNSDAELTAGALPALAATLDARPRLGAVGPRLQSADGTVEVSFGPPLTPIAEWRQRRLVRGVKRRRTTAMRRIEAEAAVEREPAWLSAACLLARREALDAVGGFDEGFFLYEEDVDLCIRLRQAGWGVLFTPSARVIHHLGRSMQSDRPRARLEYQRSHLRYYGKHNGPALTAALRLFIGGGAALGWLRALGPGEARRLRRRRHTEVLRLALAAPGHDPVV